MSSRISFGVFVVFLFVMIYFFIAPFPNYDYVQKKEESSACLQVKKNITDKVYLLTGTGEQVDEIRVYSYILSLLNLHAEQVVSDSDMYNIELMEAAIEPLKDKLTCKQQM